MEDTNLTTLVGTIINDYTITNYINSGSFGNVFSAQHNLTKDKVALKIPIINDKKNGELLLIDEVNIYKKLNKNNTSNIGIPNVKLITLKKNSINSKTINTPIKTSILVMDLLGKSLDELLKKYKTSGGLRLKTIILLTIQMLELIKYIHSCGYIHRDIKPDNFVIGYGNDCNKLYMIDFGIAKKYLKKNGKHYDFNKNGKFCGTVRYASIAAHKGYTQSRKDDLESIIYVLIYLFRGKLPWMNVKYKKDKDKDKDKEQRYNMILKMKETISEEELCNQLPNEYLAFLKYVKNMDFDEEPPYNKLIKMFKKLYDSKSYQYDKFEWS